ncbi:MAG: M48 family metalloprotease [Candidatus Midichloria sp.]|nr:M48 family metalloprotease [Candidatus Midichloria sp.]
MRFLIFIIIFFVSYKVLATELISDPEVEDIIKKMSEPIFEVAGLDKSNIKITLIKDNSINAFVLDTGNIFINLGLISETSSPIEVMGVLAHETAHITSNHHNKRAEEVREAIKKSISPTIFFYRLSQYSIMQEHAADKTAVIFMKKLGIPIEGLINVLKKIKSSHVQLDTGLYKTHPGINERVNYLSGIHVKNTNLLLNNRSFLHSYNMMKAKVIGFIWDREQVLRTYNYESSESVYAKCVADYRKHNIGASLEKLDKLIRTYPKNPYFYELKAQITLEKGEIIHAISLYKQAADLLPESDLLKKELISALLTSPTQSDWKKAENLLSQFTDKKVDGFVLEKTALAKAKLGHRLESYLYSAKAALFLEDKVKAKYFLKLIQQQKAPLSKKMQEDIIDIEESLNNIP